MMNMNVKQKSATVTVQCVFAEPTKCAVKMLLPSSNAPLVLRRAQASFLCGAAPFLFSFGSSFTICEFKELITIC